MSTDQQIGSAQFLLPTRFAVAVKRLPNVEFNVNAIDFPSIELGQVEQPNVFSAQLLWPGEKLVFSPLTIQFIIDEEMNNYFEIVDWMIANGTPSEAIGDGLVDLLNQPIGSGAGIMSDLTVYTLSNAKNPINAITFINAFPTSLSGFQFDTSDMSGDALYATTSFSYERYYRERLPQTPESK